MYREDTRQNIRGVHIEPVNGGSSVRYSATNGHILIKCVVDAATGATFKGFTMPLPVVDTIIKEVKKLKREPHVLSVIQTGDNEYDVSINGAVIKFTAIANKFPDIERVIPPPHKKYDGVAYMGLSGLYLNLLVKSIKSFTGGRRADLQLRFQNDNTKPVEVTCTDKRWYAVIMPLRINY